jgi:hypothetical protein
MRRPEKEVHTGLVPYYRRKLPRVAPDAIAIYLRNAEGQKGPRLVVEDANGAISRLLVAGKSYTFEQSFSK